MLPSAAMMKPSFTRPHDCLAAERKLAVLLPEARHLRALEQQLAPVLGGLATQYRVGRVVAGQVHIECANGAVAARLRSLTRRILDALARAGVDADGLKIRVRADAEYTPPPRKPEIGAAGRRAWSELEKSLPAGGLRDAVDRLLKHQG